MDEVIDYYSCGGFCRPERVVIESGSISYHFVQEGQGQLEDQLSIIGAILNKVDTRNMVNTVKYGKYGKYGKYRIRKILIRHYSRLLYEKIEMGGKSEWKIIYDIHCHIVPGVDDGAKDLQDILRAPERI